MKSLPLTSVLTAATLFLAPAWLSAQPAPEGKPPPPPHQARFDTNQDGKLDENERAAAEKAWRARLAENPRFLKRADTDKDGVLSDNEWAAVKEKIKSMRKQHSAKPKAHQAQWRNAEFRRGFLLGKFDHNGDRKLDQEERAQMRAAGEKRMREHLEKQLARLKAADADGDGKLNDTEWAAAKETFRQEAGARRPGKDQPSPKE